MGKEKKPEDFPLIDSNTDPDSAVDEPREIDLPDDNFLSKEAEARIAAKWAILKEKMPVIIADLRSRPNEFMYVRYPQIELALKRALYQAGIDRGIVSDFSGIVSSLLPDRSSSAVRLRIQIWPKGRDDSPVYDEIVFAY